jgi:hypothetical protein
MGESLILMHLEHLPMNEGRLMREASMIKLPSFAGEDLYW